MTNKKESKWTPEYKKEYAKKWQEENKDRIKINHKKWNENNPEYQKEYHKKYWSENKEKLLQYSKDWNKDNPNYQKEYHREYYTKNEEKIKEQRRINRERKKMEEWYERQVWELEERKRRRELSQTLVGKING